VKPKTNINMRNAVAKSESLLLTAIALGLVNVSGLSAGATSWQDEAKDDPAAGHPRPSYAGYSDVEVDAMAVAVRESRPQMFRGGWQWDRLLSRFIDGGRQERNALKILQAYFLSILDRYHEAETNGEGDAFNLFPGHGAWGSGGRLRIYEELVRQNMLTPKEQATFKQIINQSIRLGFDYANIERSANNRPYGMNGGPAIAVRIFPDMPNAEAHRRWLDALWRELAEYGDTTETNYYPYGPLFLHGLLDMAEGMGKFSTERDFLCALARRYLDYVHGGGVRGNPNSCATVIRDRTRTYADPWNAEYYGGAEQVNDGHVWYRLARHFKDPEFLWASEQVCLGGRPPEGYKIPPEYLTAYNQRYAWFIERGIKPKVPPGRSKIGYYSPLKHKVPERLYLCPGRESGKPFVSFYIYDRNNNYMHCCDDAGGRLYEYCVDGAKLLHSSGKYNNRFLGQVAYDMLSVLPPDMAFPVTADGKMGGESDDTWKMASLSLPFCLNCRAAPDSKNWYFDEQISLFRRTDDPEVGYAYGNMDGYWYLNNDFHLKSVYLGSFSVPTIIQNLRLGGPKGDLVLAAFDSIPENLTVSLVQGEQRRELTAEERKRVLTVVDEGGRGGRGLRIDVPPQSSLSLTLERLDLRFDAHKEYTRVSYDYKGRGGDLRLNGRIRPHYFRPPYNRGGVLVADSLRAENIGDDSFGQFSYRNYFSAHSNWTRQTVLTAEGYLVVRDIYEPGRGVDGYQAAPCWLLMPDGSHGENWFDAPAWDHAWWQKQKKRVLLLFHPDKELHYGYGRHETTADISRSIRLQNTFAKAIVKAGLPRIWLSVLVPFDEGQDAGDVAALIKTTVDATGTATATIDKIAITIVADGRWLVRR
jgi:hypothetical protein